MLNGRFVSGRVSPQKDLFASPCLLAAYRAVCGGRFVCLDGDYVGNWSGKYMVHSTATGYTEAFDVEQQYWLDGETLYGVSVILREQSMQSANSVTVIRGTHYYSVVTRGEIEEEYLGVPKEGGIYGCRAT